MGYRSDVAYVIKFKEPEHREAFINLVKVGDDEEKKKALAECSLAFGPEFITARFHDVKWYASYPDVQAHYRLMREATELFEACYRLQALGEDGSEEGEYEIDAEWADELYDLVDTRHELVVGF